MHNYGVVNMDTGEVIVTTNLRGWVIAHAQREGGTACQYVWGTWQPITENG